MADLLSKPINLPDNSNVDSTAVSSKHTLWAIAILLVVVMAVYWTSLSSEFVRFDDPQYVLRNPFVLRPSGAAVVRILTEVSKPSTVAGYYQPLTMLSLMADMLVTGGDEPSPTIFHLHNILLHAVTCVLVFVLLRRAAGGTVIPLILASLFAVHPLTVESVAWVSQRKTVLATPLALASLLCYMRWADLGLRRWLAASVAFYLLATLAKPTILLMPLVLPLFDIWPLRRLPVRHLAEKIPFALIMLVMGYVAAVSQASSIATLSLPNVAGLDLLRRWLALLSYNLMLYLGNVVWPLDLSPFRAEPRSLNLTDSNIALSIFITLALVITWITSWRWSKPLFVGIAAFGITLSLAMGGVRVFDSCVADRFLYFPFVFLLLPAGVGIAKIESLSDRQTYMLRGAIVLLFAPLIILNRAQQLIWHDGRTLWTHVAATTPNYSTAYLNLGTISLEENKLDEALAHAKRAMTLRPNDVEIVRLLGHVQIEQGRAADAVAFVREAVKGPLTPDSGLAYLTLAEALVAIGNLDAAREACDKSIELGQPATICFERMGDIALRKSRKYAFAVEAYREAVKRDPDNLTAQWNVGTALEASGEPAVALREYEAALEHYARLGKLPAELSRKVEGLKRQLSTTRPVAYHGPSHPWAKNVNGR